MTKRKHGDNSAEVLIQEFIGIDTFELALQKIINLANHKYPDVSMQDGTVISFERFSQFSFGTSSSKDGEMIYRIHGTVVPHEQEDL